MRIAIIADTHLGYARFEEDAFVQAEAAFLDAAEKADFIVCAGDIFDSRVPRLETIGRAVEILKKIKDKIAIYAIHGNHERRSKGMTNAAQLLASMGLMNYIHAMIVPIEKNGEHISLYGIGNMPEEHIGEAIKTMIERHPVDKNAKNVLIIHQSIKELAIGEGMALEDLGDLPFDLIINGHIHQTIMKLNEKLLIPGSTVITQLKKEEIAPKGYILYNTIEKTAEFIPIKSRPFFYEEFEFNGQTISDIRAAVEAKIAELRKKAENAVIRIRIRGTAKNDSEGAGMSFDGHEDIYVDNELAGSSLKEKLEQIKKLRHGGAVHGYGERMLIEKTKDKIRSFDAIEMFERLQTGPDEGFAYIMERIKTSAQNK